MSGDDVDVIEASSPVRSPKSQVLVIFCATKPIL